MSTISLPAQTETLVNGSTAAGSLSLRGSTLPLKSTGVLDKYSHFDNTPTIGRQFDELQLTDLLDAENSDELIKELAIIISERGVVFFKNQSIDIEQQKKLGNALGVLSGRPAASGLHIHPTERSPDLADDVSVITSARAVNYAKLRALSSQLASRGWHTDITFEPVPSDFAILKVHTLPETGGDTLWASSYDAYDRLSPAYQKFLEGLTAEHDGNSFHQLAKLGGIEPYTGVRGHPANDGPIYTARHPLVRTNPITGWKGLFVNQVFTKRIIELNKDESDTVLEYINKVYSQNHDLQVRFKWSQNDVAIWSNVSTQHAATFDYADALRVGDRVVSIGEKPYCDPASKSRREALGLAAR